MTTKPNNTAVMFSTKQALSKLWKLNSIGIIDEDHSKKKEKEIALIKFQ